jgi:hypothetical protein
MINRLALLLGGLAAAVVLAYSLVRGDQAVLSAPPAEDPSVALTPLDDATSSPREVVETVYVAAPRAPKVVHVTRREKATPRPTRWSTRTRASDDDREGREHEREREHEGREREHEEDDD